MPKYNVPVFVSKRPSISVHESPIGWSVEVWVADKLVHVERSHRRPTWAEKQALQREMERRFGTGA